MVLETRLFIFLQDQILFQRIAEHQTVFMAVFRNMRHAGLTSLTDRCVGNVLPAERDLSGRSLFQSGQPVDQFRLSVSVNTGNTEDLSFVYRKRNPADRVVLVDLGRDRQALHFKDRFTRRRVLFMYFQLYRTADHHVGKLLLVGIFRIDGTDIFAFTQYGNPVRNSHDFI